MSTAADRAAGDRAGCVRPRRSWPLTSGRWRPCANAPRHAAERRRSSHARSRGWPPSRSTTPRFFFGRERLVAEMVARLAGSPLMAIVGRSGSGKSSAMRAGLLPALAAGVLPGSEAGRSARSVRASIRCTRSSRRSRTLAPRGRLVVAVDQFEELFTACRDQGERAAFVDALVAATRDAHRQAVVLVAMRADFYGRCAAYPGAGEADRRQPRPGRPDAPRRAPPRDRAAGPARGAARRAGTGRRAGRRRRRASPARCRCCRRRCWSCGSGATAGAAPGTPTARPAVCAARWRAWPSAPTSGSITSARRSPGTSCCAWRARAKAMPSCAGACRWPSSRAKA